MRFSIIVVALNPGEKLNSTLESVFRQTCTDYEVVLKDGGSTDGSTAVWKRQTTQEAPSAAVLYGKPEELSAAALYGEAAAGRVRFFEEADKGIYDAMNQAVSRARGEFLLFLNCGDLFADERVLERTAAVIDRERNGSRPEDGGERMVLYGDTLGEKNGVVIASPPQIDGFACYRNIPCHQSCFYSAALCREKPYDLRYRIRADYDHFLWCFYRAGARMRHMGFPVSSYEGGGYSESRENARRDRREHKEITERYMPKAALLRYKLAMALTLAPLRRFLAENRVFSGAYHRVKESVYTRKRWFIIAFFFFFLEMALMLWPIGWCGEEETSFLAGEGSRILEGKDTDTGVCQEFSPQYSKLKSLGFVITSNDADVIGGSVRILVTDRENTVLAERELLYDQVNFDTYTDVELNLFLSPKESYYLSIFPEVSDNGVRPALKVCGKEYVLPENQTLTYSEELENVQILARYIYSDAISVEKVWKVLLLCVCTALAIAFTLPEKRWLKRMTGCLVLLAIPYVLGARLELLTVQESFLLPFSMKWNMAIMYAFELILLLCIQSLRVAALVADVVLTVLYSVNFFVYAFRGVPLKFSDFSAIGTAAQVVGGYDLTPNSHLAFAWCIAVLFGVVAWKAGGIKRRRRQFAVKEIGLRLASLAAGIFLTCIGGYQLLYTDLLTENGFQNFHGFDQQMIYHFNGYLVASCIDIQNSRIEMPQGYTVEKVEEILQENAVLHADIDLQEAPHIILIMNESFSDLRVLGNLELSEENLEFFYGLTENAIHGYTNASVLGGGTANSEFEAFTGCSMGLFPASYYAYQQCMTKPVNSLVSTMKSYGYKTYSVHPEQKSNWNRDRIYQYFGFDESLWKEDFENAEIIHSGISDLETYKKVEELFENREIGEKLFVFDLTMQNHGGYTAQKQETSYQVSAVNADSPEADLYLSLIKESDVAFSQLIHYFEEQDEKVIICMFGDHQPKFDDESFYSKIYADTEGLSREDILFNQYKTPFIIWANYDIEEQSGMDISINYLGPLLLQTAGLEGSAFFNYLIQLMEEYPIISVNGYQDSESVKWEWSGEKNEFIEYRMLQYNYLFDSDPVMWGF